MEKLLVVVNTAWRKSPIPKIKFCQKRIWIHLEILCILHVWNFKFDLRKGFIFFKQTIIIYGETIPVGPNIPTYLLHEDNDHFKSCVNFVTSSLELWFASFFSPLWSLMALRKYNNFSRQILILWPPKSEHCLTCHLFCPLPPPLP